MSIRVTVSLTKQRHLANSDFNLQAFQNFSNSYLHFKLDPTRQK